MLAQELAFDENSGLTISFVAEYEHGSQSLLWYSVHGGHRTDYWAVECRRTTSGKYQVTAIHEPMTYAQDIVHVILGGEDIYLVNTPSCRSVVYRNENGEVVSQTNISPEQIPCVFPLRHPVNPSTCNFVDADGNDIH